MRRGNGPHSNRRSKKRSGSDKPPSQSWFKRHGLQPANSVKIFKMLIRTKCEYAMHLTPMAKAMLSAVEAAEGIFY